MEKFLRVSGTAAPLLAANIDTDVIIPAKRLVGHERDALGAFAFEALRFRSDGAENPDFVLNQPRYREARILVAGDNFGCGSSRESAVWALAGYGLRCIIASSFGDIFANNAFQNGLLLIVLPQTDVQRIGSELSEDATPSMTVDLASQSITTSSGRVLGFEIDTERRQALLEGWDEIAMTLARAGEIDAYRGRDRLERPWIYQTDAATSR